MALSKQAREPGEIRADAVYPVQDFMARAGMSWASLRAAKSRGLKTYKVGKRTWVRGADFLAFVSDAATVRS